MSDADLEFVKWPKVKRGLSLYVEVQEKIDGTNAQVVVSGGVPVAVFSRNRKITPGPQSDNFGFAAWVEEHAKYFAGWPDGRYYGEWYGRGIGRGYGLDTRHWALFLPSAKRLDPELRGFVQECPTLDAWSALRCGPVVTELKTSVLVAGYPNPEGLVIYVDGQVYTKVVYDKAGPSPEENNGT